MNLPGICRTKQIRGYAFPGIINNGSYYLTHLEVFADGLINCWEMVDLPLFKKKLRSGWVVTSIPDGDPLSIHGIGSLVVSNAKWNHTNKTLVKFIKTVLKQLNPRMENLYKCYGRETEEIGRVKYASVGIPNTRPWKTKEPNTPLVWGIFGKSLQHFRVSNDRLFLVNIQLFPDDTAVIFGSGEPITLDFNTFANQLRNPDYFRFPNRGDRVTIEQLVTFTAGEWKWSVKPESLQAEFHDLHNQVLGKPGAVKQCIEAYSNYLSKQTKETLNQLRQKYEAVPEHLRMYCGDMDTKDIPIRMILYGKEEIKKWSHYQIAKAMNKELPWIKIPEPPDENSA